MNHKKLHIFFNFLISIMSIFFAMHTNAMDQSVFLGYAKSNVEITNLTAHQPKKSTQNNPVIIHQSPQADEIYNYKSKFAQGFAEFESIYNILLNQNTSTEYDFAGIELELRFSLTKMIQSKDFLNSKNYGIDADNILNQIYQDLDKECTEKDMILRFEQIQEIKNDLLKDQTITTTFKMPNLYESFSDIVRFQENERIRSQEEIKKIEYLTEAINNAANLFFSANEKKNELCKQVNNHIKELSQLIALDPQNSGTRIAMLESLTLNIDSTENDIQNIITTVGLVSCITLTKKRNPQDLLSSKLEIQKECKKNNYWPNNNNISGQIAYIMCLTISDELKLFVLQLMWWSIVGKEFTEEEHDISLKTPSLINIANTSVTARNEICKALRYLREKNKNNKNLIIGQILPSIKKEQNQDFPWFYNHENLNIYLEELKNHINSIKSEKQQKIFSNFLTSITKWFEGTKTTLKKQTSPFIKLTDEDKRALLLENLKNEQISLIGLNLFKPNENNNIPNNLDKDSKRYDIYSSKLKDYATERIKEVTKQITDLKKNNDQKTSNDMLLQCLQERIADLKQLLIKIPTININIVDYEYIDKEDQKKTANINVNYNEYSETINKTYFKEIQDRINKEIIELEEKINLLSPKIEISLNDVKKALGQEPFTELSNEELNNIPPKVAVTSSTIIKEEPVSPPTISQQATFNTDSFSLNDLHISNGTTPLNTQENKTPPILSNITTTTTTPPQSTVTENNEEQEKIKKQKEKIEKDKGEQEIRNAILFMSKFTKYSFNYFSNLTSYIDNLYILAKNYSNLNFSQEIKNILEKDEIINFLKEIPDYLTPWNYSNYSEKKNDLESACKILEENGHKDFTWLTSKDIQKRKKFEILFNSSGDDIPKRFIDPTYDYIQKINSLYCRPIIDKEKRTKITENYNKIVLYNTTEYENGINKLNLFSEAQVLSDLYDNNPSMHKLDPSINKLNKNLFIYTVLLTEIFYNFDKNKGLSSISKNKQAIENFEQRKNLFPKDTHSNFNTRIKNYQSIKWTTHLYESLRYILSLKWLSNLLFS